MVFLDGVGSRFGSLVLWVYRLLVGRVGCIRWCFR